MAAELETEIISADSRQVYRGMDIGTGKDLADYVINNNQISYHLIDICDAGEKYNVYEYQHDFHLAFSEIKRRNKLPVLCGGTGLYIESVLKGYKLISVPENAVLRKELATKPIEELKLLLNSVSPAENTQPDSMKRIIRAIEIAEYTKQNPATYQEFNPLNSLIIGLDLDRELRRQKITKRLKARMEEGMITEVKTLLEKGIPAEDLIYYGLEYKFVTQYLTGELSYSDMLSQLEIAIHQFAKRQMTWFRGMERRGFNIHWLDATNSTAENVQQIKSLL